MIPGVTLRNVLESTPNLSLKQLLQCLETHFDERNATDLCSNLTSMVQLPEENEYQNALKSDKKLYWHPISLTLTMIRNWSRSFFIVL